MILKFTKALICLISSAYAAVLKCECNRKTYTAVATQINPRELTRTATFKTASPTTENDAANGSASL